ncbi:endothelin-2-like [Oncorhynchus nerka]|uniref:endothelin-2-like n=1 Tax=Oncorhynchus nerka TaxID=8023 RepID=UPI001130C405|nr:endothelin-2-like [Oncorhynchus nerka]
MSAHTSLLLLITVCVSMQEGFGLPLSERPKSSDLAPPHRVRTKRCACNNQLDSECHYFCHLDIIWVNTPSKTTVYGLGSPLSRRRRSAGRCVCADSDDHTCTSFCQDRSMVRASERARGWAFPPRKEAARAPGHNER